MVRARDGFYHPASEPELVSLVLEARRRNVKLRVRGSAHSVAHAIYAGPRAKLKNRVNQQSPPPGADINVMLDMYARWRVKCRRCKLVEADAGIHLGEDPRDPTGRATLQRSLLWQLWYHLGWTLSDVGGISHQTVSGFTATGSAGGSVAYSANRNVHALRVVDGTGEIYEVSDPEAGSPDCGCSADGSQAFYAMVPNLGLLGVVSTITFRCVETFNIKGSQTITTPAKCRIDLFGDGDSDRRSLEQFLRETEYARVEWWPQRGAERVLVWEARQIVPTPGFIPRPYRQFGTRPKLVQVGGSLVFTLLGKLGDLPDLPSGPPDGGVLAAARRAVKLATRTLRRPIAYLVGRLTPTVFPRLLRKFEETDAEQPDEAKRRPQCFEDFAWHGLPMDNEASDRLMPTEFTEIWVPLLCTARVMDILHREFGGGADARTAYRHTGTFAWELYAEMSSRFWLNAAYTTGAADDPWREGAFRVDIYWFERNTGDPTLTFFRQFWSLLRRHDIPFRLHWGKFLPDVVDDPWWAAEVADRYEMRDAFLAERARRDPDDLFLTDYWREHLGLTGTGGPVAPI